MTRGTIQDSIETYYIVCQVHCNTYFELDGETEANCTPYGWSNKKNVCIRKYLSP